MFSYLLRHKGLIGGKHNAALHFGFAIARKRNFGWVKGVRFRQLKSLLLFLIKHPFFFISTLKATFDVLRISQKEFPNTHGFHNKANAFRHALWNIFIAKQCSLFSRKKHKIISWTKEFTDWHEDFSPNEELPRIMDLHNN